MKQYHAQFLSHAETLLHRVKTLHPLRFNLFYPKEHDLETIRRKNPTTVDVEQLMDLIKKSMDIAGYVWVASIRYDSRPMLSGILYLDSKQARQENALLRLMDTQWRNLVGKRCEQYLLNYTPRYADTIGLGRLKSSDASAIITLNVAMEELLSVKGRVPSPVAPPYLLSYL